MDNASVCDVLARAAGIMLLKKYGLQFHPQNAWICCLAHVVNLIVQCLLALLNEAEDPKMDDYYIPNKHLPFHYDPDDNEEVQQMEGEGDEMEGGEEEDEFIELLHPVALEDDELEGVLDSTVDLSEVKKVNAPCNMDCSRLNSPDYVAAGNHHQELFITPTSQPVLAVCEGSVWLNARTASIK
jgi:hypothetical protein